MRRYLTCLLLTASVVAAVVVAPAHARAGRGAADPLRLGPHNVDELDYDGGNVIIRDPNGVPMVQDLRGTIHLPDGRGPFPLLLFLHGRHATCRYADLYEMFGYPCPEARPVTSDVASYRGYDYLAHNLATHGYVVVSASANAVNSYDLALLLGDDGMEWRAEVVAHTLDALARWNRDGGRREVDRRLDGMLDLSRIGLMGHSRGGEGVARFVRYNRTRDGARYPGLRAVMALAPTDFYRQRVPGVHFGTIVPLCDGDVYNLQGHWMFDDARFDADRRHARVMFTVNGTNHNYFNTVWTFDDGRYGGDDSGENPACKPRTRDSVRITAREQRAVGLALMAGFLRRYVGGERSFDGLVTGAVDLPVSACPKRGLPCDRLVGTSYVGPDEDHVFADSQGVRWTERGSVRSEWCVPNRGGGCGSFPNRSTAEQLTVTWDGHGSLRIPTGGIDADAFRALTLRTGINFRDRSNPRSRSQNFWVTLVQASGARRSVAAARFGNALYPPAGPRHQQLTLNGLRIPLSAFGLDSSNVTAVELRFGELTRSGSIQLTDVGFSR